MSQIITDTQDSLDFIEHINKAWRLKQEENVEQFDHVAHVQDLIKNIQAYKMKPGANCTFVKSIEIEDHYAQIMDIEKKLYQLIPSYQLKKVYCTCFVCIVLVRHAYHYFFF